MAVVGLVSLFTRGADVNIEAGSQVEMVFQRPLILEQENLAEGAAPGAVPSMVPAANQPKPLEKPGRPVVLCPPGRFGLQLASLTIHNPNRNVIDSENTAVTESSSPPDANPPAGTAPHKERSAGAGLGLWLRDLLISAGVSILIILFLYQPVRVEGTSMLPRLEDHDRLFINKFVYHITSIERDDVVVFHYPRDPAKSYIKRVIALPGDRLRIDHGQVWVNGKALVENYVPLTYRDTRSYAETVIPDDCILRDGRPPIDLIGQQGIRSGGAGPDLWQGRIRLLAGERYGRSKVESLLRP